MPTRAKFCYPTKSGCFLSGAPSTSAWEQPSAWPRTKACLLPRARVVTCRSPLGTTTPGIRCLDRGVALIVFSTRKFPVAARVVNVSRAVVDILPHTRVATLAETDRLPLGTNFVRPGSLQYEEREFLVYENTRSRAAERRLSRETWEQERNAPWPLNDERMRPRRPF